jgi:uncharacterized protein YkwD
VTDGKRNFLCRLLFCTVTPHRSAHFKNMLRAWVVLVFVAIAAVARGNCSSNPGDRDSSDNEFRNCVDSTALKHSSQAKLAGEDFDAENELLKMANKSRDSSGAPALRMDGSLREAARQHALRMISSDRLEHQYSGEPALLQRIAMSGPLKMDYAGENIAFASCPVSANDALMHSPSHRQNLLDREFNVAGMAAIWSHGRLYVVQDFAHELASYSANQSDKLVGTAVGETRRRAGLPELKQMSPAKLDEAACSLSQEKRPNAHLLAAAYRNSRVIAYTQGRPEALPVAAQRALGDPDIRRFAVGACYARNAAYPNGTYWIAIILY